MPIIDLARLPGKSLLHKLLNYLKEVDADFRKGFHITIPEVFPAERQRGETCKLKALADAMQQASCRFNCYRPPLYKEKQRDVVSLRQIAKRLGSVVGEVYSAEMLQRICEEAGFVGEFYNPYNEDEWIETVCLLIDKNLAPIIFYDVDTSPTERKGYARIGDGKNEHAATVVGYYRTELDETRFILTLWGDYYDMDAMELALSSCYALADRREPETFIKVHLDGETRWKLVRSFNPNGEEQVLHDVLLRKAPEMPSNATPLKGKIFTITGLKRLPSLPLTSFFSSTSKAPILVEDKKEEECVSQPLIPYSS
ncbi:hypothetical protein [Legionella yabuuchiae]|uniref:hypothetical protein n=1 Tax=Legionella yabuuchiae TaxID=376727 RepID=UPI001054D898|nr:hypothetical protein [Legionella yabuuchiae]